ncbi:hypothetical protein K488DRAFT_81818 [Vararia minispora EC-137]|uniref:Uncharacterized protein n=1 Tax=Vararia minispora EC-137 TaxID=1314806 RepID=A0ACB8QZ23_9AGAM|nr:hypothetical protein K488DRAFT_81818 [Vararia minispora EC-137]
MTLLFRSIRIFFYVSIFLLTVAVLGLSAYFAEQFSSRGGFSIFSLVVPSVTIIWGIFQLMWAQPRTEAVFLFVTGVLWLAEAAWATDETPRLECFDLRNMRTQTTRGSISAESFCYESRIVEAFSWTIFLCLAIAFVILVSLANKSKVLGHPDIWYEPVDWLPWYGELPGEVGGRWFQSPYHMYHHRYGYGQFGQQMMGAQPGGAVISIGGQTYTQMPGHSMVIRPGINGGPPVVEHVRGHIQSV